MVETKDGTFLNALDSHLQLVTRLTKNGCDREEGSNAIGRDVNAARRTDAKVTESLPHQNSQRLVFNFLSGISSKKTFTNNLHISNTVRRDTLG